MTIRIPRSFTAALHQLVMRKRPVHVASLVACAFGSALATVSASAQSLSGFNYNGQVYVSYQANEYQQTPQGPQGLAAIRSTGANYTAIVVTQYEQTYTANTIAPETTTTPGYDSTKDSLSPTDDAVVAAIKNAQAQGLTVFLKPQVDSLDGVFRGSFAPTNPTAWFASYQTFILHYAQLASANNVGGLVIGTELASLSKSTYAANWDNIIAQIRASYPNLTLAYGANATSATDEFTTVSFWDKVDIIGVDGYFPLTNHADPTVAELVAAWTDSKSGFNIVAALKALQSKYNKPLIFTELGYVSAAGTNEAPYASAASGAAYDPTEQENCYEAFFEVFSQQSSWMKGVFWWAWNVSPPGSNDRGYTPQNKPAATTTLPKWFGSTTPSFTITPSNSTVAIGGGLNITDTISVTNLGGFTGAVTLAATGLPAGVTASFAAGSVTGTQVLTLSASSSATTGPASVTVTGTSGSLTASTAIALTVQAPNSQSISFATPAPQTVGTPLTLSATATSGLPVAFTSESSSVCTVSNTTASFLTAGTCTITASQAGNSTYAAATPVAVSFQVSAVAPVPVPAADDIIVSQVNWLDPLTGYVQTSNNATGGSFAANTVGQVAVADTNNLILINALTGSATTLGAWSGASAVAVDAKNNLYVGTLYGAPAVLVKLPYTGASTNGGYAAFAAPTASTPVCTTASTTECTVSAVGSVYPSALAFDATGDLFWVTSSSRATSGNSIYECTASCLAGSGSPVQIFQEPTASTPPSSSSGQLLIGGIAIDPSGNIFFTDSSSYVNTATYSYTSFSSNLNELPVSSGAGYGGLTTGYAGAPSVLYTLTPASVGPYNNEVDAVTINASTGTVYFADQSDGTYAFPNDGHAIPTANGMPTAMYAVSLQGAKTLTIDGGGNLYVAASSSALKSSGADTVGRISLATVTVPASAVNTAVSPSATVNPVTTLLNDVACSSMPSPFVTFAAGASTTASATVTASGSCTSTLTGGAAFATNVSFTPLTGGSDSIGFTATDQSSNTAAITVTGVGQVQVAAQTITFNNPGPQVAGSTLTLSASASSGLTVAFTSATTSVCTVSGSTATFLMAGTCTIDANQSGNASYSAAPQVQDSFTVNPAPTFTLSAASPSLPLTQGSTATDVITINAANGFAGAVALTASGLPSGVSASFSTNPATGSSTLTLTATSSAATGAANVTVTGTSGSLTASVPVALTVNAPPSFKLAAATPSLSVVQANNVTDTITITPLNGFSGPVTLSASGLPSGVTATFATNPATSSSVLTLTATASAALGTTNITITGTSGTLSTATPVALTVSVPASFTLTAASPSASVLQGATASETITVNSAGGFSGNVTLSASGLPSGVTATFSTNPATSTSQLTFTAGSTAAIGSSTVTITGTSGGLTASTTVSLSVSAPPSVTVTPNASSITVTRGTPATETISVAGSGGFTGTVSLTAAVTSSPQGAQDLPTLTFGTTGTVNVTATGGGSATLSITTTPPSTASVSFPRERNAALQFASVALASWCLFGLCIKRRRSLKLFLSMLSFVVLAGATGCSGNSSTTPPNSPLNPGTTPGVYAVTVTATSGAVSTNSVIQITVQ